MKQKMHSPIEVSVGIIEPKLHQKDLWGDKKRRYLLASRPKGKYKEGYWEFPGGKRELGETPQEALCRELHEELAIRVVLDDLRFVMTRIYGYEDFEVKLHIYKVLSWKGPLAPQEGQEVRFVSWEESLEMSLLPANRDFAVDLEWGK